MNLPKIDPIVWEKPKREERVEVNPVQIKYIPLPPRDDVRRDYIGNDGILHTHYPGIPESYKSKIETFNTSKP